MVYHQSVSLTRSSVSGSVAFWFVEVLKSACYSRKQGREEAQKFIRKEGNLMERAFHLPSWMSPEVARSHEVMLRLAAERPKRDNRASYFVNSEEPPYNPRSDAQKNRSVCFDLDIDENGFVKE